MSKKPESLLGQRFGKWVVIGEPITINERKHSLCKCDCGKEKMIVNYSLKNNMSKSCGCSVNDRELENLIGKKFGKLTVIGEPFLINGRSHSLCKCECGNEKKINQRNLKNGNTKSCGCLNHTYKLKAKDFVGQKFGKLTVIGESEKIGKFYYALCKCECGNEKKIRTQSLITGESKTCGLCLEKFPIRLKKIFNGMKQRCLNEKATNYNRYGGRGIKVCKEWLEDSYSFYTWALKNGYDENLSLDRIDPDKNYEPSNCKWATTQEQSNNKCSSIFIIFNNVKKTLGEWSKIYGIEPSTARYRYKKDLPFEEIFEINKTEG